MIFDPAKALVTPQEFSNGLNAHYEKEKVRFEKKVSEIYRMGAIARELPQEFKFNDIFIFPDGNPAVRSQAQTIEEALSFTKLFTLERLYKVQWSGVGFKTDNEMYDHERRGDVMEVHPIIAKISGLRTHPEEVKICFHAKLKTMIVELSILLLDDTRISRHGTPEELAGRRSATPTAMIQAEHLQRR